MFHLTYTMMHGSTKLKFTRCCLYSMPNGMKLRSLMYCRDNKIVLLCTNMLHWNICDKSGTLITQRACLKEWTELPSLFWKRAKKGQQGRKRYQQSKYIKLLAPELFFLILAHPVYKMWIIQEPNKLELWNKLHLKKNREYTPSLKYSVPIFVE